MKTRRKNKSKSVRRIGGMLSRFFSRSNPVQTEEEKKQVTKVIKFIDDFIESVNGYEISITNYICMNLKVIKKELEQNSDFIKKELEQNSDFIKKDFVLDTPDALSLITQYKKYRLDKYDILSETDNRYLTYSFCLQISFLVCKTVQNNHSKNTENAEKIERLAIEVDNLLFATENRSLTRGFDSIYQKFVDLNWEIYTIERAAKSAANAAAKSAANAAAKSAANAAAKSAANAAAKSAANAAANAAGMQRVNSKGGHRTTRKRRRRSSHNKYFNR